MKLTLLLALLVVGCIPLNRQFHTAAEFSVGEAPYGAFAADFNGDGKLDLVVTHAHYPWNGTLLAPSPGTLTLYLGRGDGTFAEGMSTIGSSISKSPCIADLNGDGKLDLAVTDLSENGKLGVLLGNGDGTFRGAQFHLIGANASGVKAGDLNGDGKVDLVYVIYRRQTGGTSEWRGGALAVMLGHGDGTFEAPTVRDLGAGPRQLWLSDLNSDGKLDLAIADENDRNGAALILYGSGDGTFGKALSVSVSNPPVAATAPDLNGDGRPDLVIAMEGGVESFLNVKGNYKPIGSYQTYPTRSAFSADFDKNGTVDIATTMRILSGDGKGGFTPSRLAGTEYDESYVYGGDFNGDGFVDLIATDRVHNRIKVYLNRGGTGMSATGR